jgi:spore coat polysaccharide biosynthesis protein SpsF (cytidylyltransferase family)
MAGAFRAVIGIQARTSSVRLPGKVLADLAGKPLIERVWRRASRSRLAEQAVVLTSTEASDDELCRALSDAEIPHRRGPLQDVLARFVALAAELGATHVVRVTGDCPLIEPEYLDLLLEGLAAFDADVVTLALPSAGVLAGAGAMSVRALYAAAESQDPRDREHVGSFWLTRNRAALRAVELHPPAELARADLRLCVDEAPDLELVRAVFEGLAPSRGDEFSLAEALRWLDARPELALRNDTVEDSPVNRAARMLESSAPPHQVVGIWPPEAEAHATPPSSHGPGENRANSLPVQET